jgi:hypothetical protein
MANTQIGKFWLFTPWIILALGTPLLGWWMLEPVPLKINYVAPCFTSRPAINRDDALSACVDSIHGGTVVFRFVSYCVSRPFEATSRRSWVGKAIVWPAPDLPTMLSRTPGCYEANIAVETPTSSPTRRFSYIQELQIPMSPVRTATISYSPIPLTILDSKD